MSKRLIVLVLMLNYFLFGLLLNSVGVVIMQSINSFGVTKESASLLEGFKDIPIAVVSFLVASFLPRLGYRYSMMIGLAVVMLACLSMPILSSFWATKMLFLATGSSFALIKVSVYASIGLLTTDKQGHASLMNAIEGVFMLGVLSGYWVFSFFIDSDNPASQEWLSVYWWLAGICLFNLIVMSFIRFGEGQVKPPGSSLGRDFVAMLRLTTRPLVYIFVMSVFLYVLIEQGLGTWLPTFNNEVLGLPSAISVQVTSIFALSLAVGRLSAGLLLQKVNWYFLLSGCILGMGLLMILVMPLSYNVEVAEDVDWFSMPLVAYLIPLIGLFMSPIYPALSSVVLSSLPLREQSSMAGLIIMFSALGGTTGAMITGVIFGRFDGQTAFYMALIPMAIILVLLHGLKRETDRASAELERS